MNFFERAVALVSPKTALKRKAARSGVRLLEQWDGNWTRNTGNPDDARPARFIDRARVLNLVASNPYARKALNTLVNNAVGWGITGSIKGNKSAAKLWAEWVKVADFHGRLDLYGLQELAARTMFRAGEVFIVLREVADAVNIPLRLQLIDPAQLATTLNTGKFANGVEYDDDWRPVRYHFSRARPGAPWSSADVVSFPAADVIHLFMQEEVGQRHGKTVFEPVIKRLSDIDESLEADLVRRKIEACFVAFRTMSPDVMGDPALTERESRGEGIAPAETVEPGMIETLLPGEDIKFGEPKAAGGLGEAVKINLLATAAGLNIMYEHITGDLSNVNYSSYRAGALEFQRTIGRIQYNTIIPVALNRIGDRWLKTAFEWGRTGKRQYEMKWTPPPFESVDPEKTAKGQILEMQAGFETRRNLIAARGYDYDDHMAEIAADKALEASLGLIFPADTPKGNTSDAAAAS